MADHLGGGRSRPAPLLDGNGRLQFLFDKVVIVVSGRGLFWALSMNRRERKVVTGGEGLVEFLPTNVTNV